MYYSGAREGFFAQQYTFSHRMISTLNSFRSFVRDLTRLMQLYFAERYTNVSNQQRRQKMNNLLEKLTEQEERLRNSIQNLRNTIQNPPLHVLITPWHLNIINTIHNDFPGYSEDLDNIRDAISQLP
jgi:gas vesicle protein